MVPGGNGRPLLGASVAGKGKRKVDDIPVYELQGSCTMDIVDSSSFLSNEPNEQPLEQHPILYARNTQVLASGMEATHLNCCATTIQCRTSIGTHQFSGEERGAWRKNCSPTTDCVTLWQG